ncbi:unnamed protein product, partial [Brassica rapa subsp. narinosa]
DTETFVRPGFDFVAGQSFNGKKFKEDDEASHRGGFNKGKEETVEHYRALLRLSNEYRLSENDWNLASSKANSIAVQIELLEDIIKADGKFDLTAELEKLNEEHSEAKGMLADVKVKVPDWDKLGKNYICFIIAFGKYNTLGTAAAHFD